MKKHPTWTATQTEWDHIHNQLALAIQIHIRQKPMPLPDLDKQLHSDGWWSRTLDKGSGTKWRKRIPAYSYEDHAADHIDDVTYLSWLVWVMVQVGILEEIEGVLTSKRVDFIAKRRPRPPKANSRQLTLLK